MKLILTACGAFLLTISALAQSSETPIYRKQFADLVHSTDEEYAAALQSPASREDRQDLNSRLFALEKTAHRLQETVEEANYQALTNHKDNDKSLLLIGQGCVSIDAVLTAMSNYLNTDDRTFLAIAAEIKPSISLVLKAY